MKPLGAIRRRLRAEKGQALPMVALAMVALIAFAGLVIDIGRVWVAQKQLQGAVDSAALVAGQDLPNSSTAFTQAVNYSGLSGDNNALTGYQVSAASPNVTFECLSHAPNYTAGTGSGLPTCPADSASKSCQPTGASAPQPTGVTTCNAVNVKQTATVTTTFLGLFRHNFTITASSTAAARGGVPHPLNVEVILDTTQSMTDSCSSSVTGISSNPQKLDCAKAGMRALLQALWPCNSTLTTCGAATTNTGGQLGANVAAAVDEVGLEVFPAISGNPPSPAATTTDREIDCTNYPSSKPAFKVTYPTYTPYTYSATQPNGGIPTSDEYSGYQAVGLSSDYRPSVSNTTLNATTSNLVEAVDWGQCPGGTYPGGNYYGLKDIGGQGSYLAGAITEAQYQLTQAPARQGVTNAIIVLSDGELNQPSTFTDNNPCQSAVNAATQAKAAGTVIYSIAYNSSGNCADTSKTITALSAMQQIASNSETFFNQPTSGDLTSAFQQVGEDLTDSRLIPDCTQAPPAC